MANVPPQFESRDVEGVTVHFSSSGIGVTPVSFPSVADKPIEELLIIAGANGASRIWVSFDDGANWLPIYSQGHLIWSLKKNSSGSYIYQFKVKGDVENLSVFGLINFSS